MTTSKNILIVGATGGIGQSLVNSLHKSGAKLLFCARNAEKLQALANQYSCPFFVGDISDAESAKDIFDQIATHLAVTESKLDGLVNLAGSIVLKPAHLTSISDWDSVIRQNLSSAFHCIKFAVPLLSSSSSVVLMSSAAARIGLANHEAIAAAKAGVIGLTKSAAATYANKGIRFNCLAPGLVRTQLSEKITSNPASEKASLSLHALKRIGEPADIAPMIEFLLSDNSSWITGQVIGTDGGLADIKLLQS